MDSNEMAAEQEHEEKRLYQGRASFDFVSKEQFQSDGFSVTCAGHTLAECEDSEIADFICNAWNVPVSAAAPEPQPAISAEGAEPWLKQLCDLLTEAKAVPVIDGVRWTQPQPEGAERVALPPLEFTPEGRDSIYSAESENYYTLKCRERQLHAQIAANARLQAERDEIKAQRDEAIAAVRELDPAWEAQWNRATKAEAELAAAQAELARMKGEA